MKQLHTLQLQILKKALFSPTLRYSDLKPNKEMENNLFDFHLDQLIAAKLIEKQGSTYKLSNMGKEYANQMDTEQTLVQKQAKISAMIVCTRKKAKQNQFLIYTRFKHPFYGCQGFPTGKVGYGEKVVSAAVRELQEETGLIGTAKIVGIRHYIVLDKNTNDLLEDKFMFICLSKNPKGLLKPNNEGKFEWVSEIDFPTYVTNHFESYGSFIEQLKLVKDFDGEVKLEEIVHKSSKF